MDKRENLVEKIRMCLNEYIRLYGNVNFAMLLKDIGIDTYTFMIASPMLNFFSEYDAISVVAKHFFSNLDLDAKRMISRINVINTMDPLLPNMYLIEARNTIMYINNCKFQNVVIGNAILMESHKD
ncbi:MAG: hypothetical protein ACRC1T_11885 [Clostridium chrysemydis]|uniref:hypothetical protein n=1 Tax=Clostridium chrysemydis TaxID=2665504 RepID=UPI003F34CA79